MWCCNLNGYIVILKFGFSEKTWNLIPKQPHLLNTLLQTRQKKSMLVSDYKVLNIHTGHLLTLAWIEFNFFLFFCGIPFFRVAFFSAGAIVYTLIEACMNNISTHLWSVRLCCRFCLMICPARWWWCAGVCVCVRASVFFRFVMPCHWQYKLTDTDVIYFIW